MTIIIGIGSSAAGLSTYLATLAYHQKHQVKSLKVLSCQVTPISADERKLSYKAENILKEQVMLEVTEFYDSFCYHPLYSFTITLEIKGLFWTKNTEKVSFGIYDMLSLLLSRNVIYQNFGLIEMILVVWYKDAFLKCMQS